jgi:CRISPR-associated Csx11 family protein
MSAFAPAETLREHRPLLLAMEAIGWFHMAGKARSEFLRYHGGDRVDYRYEKWHDYETPPFPWDDLLGWVRSRLQSKVPSNAWPGSFKEFTEKHKEKDPGLLGLLQASHGIVSGVEKNLPEATSKYLGQSVPHMWLSSPWGYPKRNLLVDPPEVLTPNGWKQVVSEIRRILEELKNLGTQNVQDVGAWWRWREKAIGPDSFIRGAFLSTLAETRLPNNDVTLWDQSYVAAAIFKSAVAGALLNSGFPWGDRQIRQKTRWRLLTVAIGTEHYEARAVKIGDWTGIQAALERFFEEVRRLIEVDLAAGSLLYRDSSAAVFSFPGEREDENVPAPWLSGWKEWLQEQIDEIAKQLDLETPPEVRLSQPTRSLVPMVGERAEAVKSTMVPVHRAWSICWKIPEESRGHVCPVCGMRRNGDPTSKGKPCAVCRARRHHRRDDWLSGRLGYDTIWFEEAADSNGRLAVLTLSLDLEPWLDGKRVDSLRAQAISEWRRFNPTLKVDGQVNPNPIAPCTPLDSLLTYIRNSLSSFNPRDPVLSNLQEGFRHEKDWPTFFQKIVEDRAAAPTWDNLSDEQRAAWLAHQLFCKLPSPGRVYRFWREAIKFFEDLLREFRQIASRSDNPWRVRRLLLIPDASTAHGWKDGMLYDGRWRGVQISLVYVDALKGFVTASNLARLLKPEEHKEALQNQTITVEEEDTFGQSVSLTVQSIKELSGSYAHLGVYHPVIPLEVSPLRFRVVLPLEAASECVDLAIARWREQFARVWDRLPLRVGVVGFPRALSFQAVVEAVRNVEEAPRLRQSCGYRRALSTVRNVEEALRLPAEIWRVEETQIREGVLDLSLRRKDGQNTLWCIPLRLPDGREDVFYPYVEVEDRTLRYPRDFRHPENGRVFRHVADLRVGDGIRVTPAKIVALWMESTATRFDAPKPYSLEDWTKMRAVWELLTRVAPSITAVQLLRNAIVEMETQWRSPNGLWGAPMELRRETLRALFAEHLEVQGAALETLVACAMEDLFSWTLEWHLTALHEKPQQRR